MIVVVTLLGAIVVLTVPYCGALFHCGCTWPWAGLAEHCNFYDLGAPLHCPWCEHPLAGAVSLVAAALAGLWVSLRRLGGGSLARILSGIVAFLVVGAAAGWLTALASAYPQFSLAAP